MVAIYQTGQDITDALRRGVSERQIEQDLRTGESPLSLQDIRTSLYDPWAKRQALDIMQGDPVSQAFRKSAGATKGRQTWDRAGLSDRFKLAGVETSEQGDILDKIKRQKAANQFYLNVPNTFSEALRGIHAGQGAFETGKAQDVANVAGGAGLGASTLGGVLGIIAGAAPPTAPVLGPLAAILAGAGGAGSLAAKGALDASLKSISEKQRAGLGATSYKSPFSVDVAEAPGGTTGLALQGGAPSQYRYPGLMEQGLEQEWGGYTPPSWNV